MVDHEISLNPILLEEVFSEVERSELLKKPNGTASEFLEDVVKLEKETLSSRVNSRKKKKTIQAADNSKNLHDTVIQEDLPDSSKDENNEYLEILNEYSECGKYLKNLIEYKTRSKFTSKEGYKAENSWKKSKSEREELKNEFKLSLPKVLNDNDFLLDPILGMHIINPRFSSASLKEKIAGKISIGTLQLKKFVETTAAKDSNWVTGGAIVNKFTRTSQKGNQYCVWHITDLKGDVKIVCVFLFGSAFKQYWNTSLGSVVGILNPIVMNNKEKSEVTLRVDNALAILLMGISRDYGLCRSKKSNGENCSSVVNKSKCDYCIYHMKKEYDRACGRSDLQPPKIERSLNNLRAKVFGKSQVSCTRKAFSGLIGKKSVKQREKDDQRIKLLTQRIPGPSNARGKKDESVLNMVFKNTEITQVRDQNPSKSESQFIDLGFTVTKKERNAAKAFALKYIQEHGPIKRILDTAKKTPKQILSIKRKVEAEELKECKKAKLFTSVDSLKQTYLKNGITDEFLKLMNSESRNTEILKVAEDCEREKYFAKLETREKIENKMASTFKIECKAVRCLKCNYKSFSASDLCKKEKHTLKVVNAIKRFWKCGNCSGRTVCLELLPLHSCKVCGSSKWVKTSMMPEKKGSDIIVEKLSLRGDEEKFIGTPINQANLNLLVPENS